MSWFRNCLCLIFLSSFSLMSLGWPIEVCAQEPTLAEGPAIERLPELLPPEEVPAEATADPLAAGGNSLADADVIVAEEVVAPPKLWSGSFDMGLNGSQGNTEVFNFRFNLAAIRETARQKLTLKSNYALTNTQGTADSVNRLFFEGRNEWKFGESPWTIYVHNTTENDQYQPWRTRIGLDTGLGYKLISNEKTSLTGRAGPSVSHEFQGANTEWVPELATGLQLEHKISKLQKLYFQIDYFPSVEDFKDYRMNTQASWEIVLDEVNNLSLKLSALSRYDSTPDNGTPQDLDYAATLLWAF